MKETSDTGQMCDHVYFYFYFHLHLMGGWEDLDRIWPCGNFRYVPCCDWISGLLRDSCGNEKDPDLKFVVARCVGG